MEVYILSRKDLKCIAFGNSTTYNYPVSSASGRTGNVQVYGLDKVDYAGNWLLIDNHVLFINETSPANGVVNLVVVDPIEAFSRGIPWSDVSNAKYGTYIYNNLLSEYKNQSDQEYAMPYLVLSNSDSTPYEPTTPDDGVFNLNLVMRRGRRRGVIIKFSVVGEFSQYLMIDISPPIVVDSNVFFDDGHSTLYAESYSWDMVSKATILKDGSATTYYLQQDGNFSTTIPSPRVDGKWSVTGLEKDDDTTPYEAAEFIFKNNVNSHKIEFESERVFELYQPVAIRVRDRVLYSYITYIGKRSDSNWLLYECGELKNTLIERLNWSYDDDYDMLGV